MNIREQILADFGKPNMLKVVEWIGGNPKRFATLMDCFMADEYRLVQRSAWVVSLVADNHPELLLPYLDRLVARMQEEGHVSAVRRNITRILQFVDLPEGLQGVVLDSCFAYAANPAEEIAVRSNALVVLARLAKIYPEIGPELNAVIEEGLAQGATPAFRASARKVAKMLSPKKVR